MFCSSLKYPTWNRTEKNNDFILLCYSWIKPFQRLYSTIHSLFSEEALPWEKLQLDKYFKIPHSVFGMQRPH